MMVNGRTKVGGEVRKNDERTREAARTGKKWGIARYAIVKQQPRFVGTGPRDLRVHICTPRIAKKARGRSGTTAPVHPRYAPLRTRGFLTVRKGAWSVDLWRMKSSSERQYTSDAGA